MCTFTHEELVIQHTALPTCMTAISGHGPDHLFVHGTDHLSVHGTNHLSVLGSDQLSPFPHAVYALHEAANLRMHANIMLLLAVLFIIACKCADQQWLNAVDDTPRMSISHDGLLNGTARERPPG